MKYLICSIIFFTAITAYAEQYVCISDQLSGFVYDHSIKSWKAVIDNSPSSKYIFKKTDPKTEVYQYKVFEFGTKNLLSACKHDFDEYGFISCSDGGEEFKFNKKNGRFLHSFEIGYFNVLPSINNITDSISSPPFMEIGKCSKL